MKLSIYQENFLAAIDDLNGQPKGCIIVEAVPGSGKSTTSRLGMERAQGSVLVLAFNKHIADAMKSKVPSNVSVATVNSFGHRAVMAAYKARFDEYKTRNAMRVKKEWEGPITRLVSLKKATLLTTDELVRDYDLELPSDDGFMEAAKEVWIRVTRDTSSIDYDDQWFLPVVKKLPVQQYDWVFVDEAQDLSATQMQLLMRIAPRVVAVGDPRQSIYGFRGADPRAMTKLKEATGAKVLPLSICYRCPKEVVKKVNSVYPVVESAPGASDGVVDTVPVKELLNVSKDSWVLCRCTAPLISQCLRFLVAGVKATVKGRDIGKQLAGLIDKIGGEIPEFYDRLSEYEKREMERLEKLGRPTQVVEDKVESIRALSEGVKSVDEIKRRIENVFSDVGSGVTFATVHRSKGLECDDVYILEPGLMPHKSAKSPLALEQEKNLMYVAYSRAMKRLRFVV